MPRAKGTPKTGGRAKGVPNKATTEFRVAITRLLELNAENYAEWLRQVAETDPAKALDLIAKLAEYAAPKLARSEVTGPGGEPLQVQPIVNLTLTRK
jgi:hypothetical protein